MYRALGTASLLMLTACTTVDGQSSAAQLEYVNLTAQTRRAIDVAYRDLPFESGRIYVIANEDGDMGTYALTPCQGGNRICGAAGRVGQVERTPDYYVVTGAYRDRTFYLSPGGDGYLTFRGVNRDLAWN